MIIISLVFMVFLIYFNIKLNETSFDLNCNPSEQCMEIKNLFNYTNIGFGFFGFMFALGFYLLLFNKTEEKIMKRLEDEKNNKLEEGKFEIILTALDEFEKRVLISIREQDGITQNTLKLRTDLSKTKLCYVLQELEKRGLIKRIPKGKTLAIWLRI